MLEKLFTEFALWHESIKEEAKLDAELFSQALSKDPIELYSQLQDVEKIVLRSADRVSKAEELLSKISYGYSVNYEDMKPTEMKVKLASDVAEFKLCHDRMENIASAVSKRIMAAESLLKWHQPTMMRGIS